MNKKVSGWLAALIIGVSIAGFTTSMPIAYARGDNLMLDGTSSISQNKNCQISTPTLSCAAAIGLNTTRANDVVILAMFADGMSASQIIDKSGLNFTARFESAGSQIAEYYAIAPSVMINDNTTVVFSAARHALTFAVTFAVAGANPSRVSDPSTSLPANTVCPTPAILPACSLNIPTKLADEFVFAITAIGDSPRCVTGFANLFSNGWLEVDYTVPTARGTITFSCSRIDGTEPVAIVADAIFPHPSNSLSTS